MKEGIGFGIDRGGTFTDVFVVYPDGNTDTFKLLSEDINYPDAPTEAIRRVLSHYKNVDIPRGQKIPTEDISFIRMGTTVATNALLERKGEKTALFITSGFKDLLKIGNQARSNIFQLNIPTPEMLYDEVYEVEERIYLDDPTCEMDLKFEQKVGLNGQKVIIAQEIDESKLCGNFEKAAEKGIQSIAVALLHSYIYPEHEKTVKRIALEHGFKHVSISSEVSPMIKIVPRAFTATADAYLTPIIQTYIECFKEGFENNLEGVIVEFMRSDGGLCSIKEFVLYFSPVYFIFSFVGSKAILSGPAGGVVGVSYTAYDEKTEEPVIAFDMGGTSTDVSRYAGHFNEVIESETDGIIILSPQLEINTVAAGGGSRLFFKNGLFVVGPESSGSNPGPLCYRRNGFLSLTDANVVLNRIVPEFFPSIFGENGDQPLDYDSAYRGMEELASSINKSNNAGREMSVTEVALGFIKVANEAMCRPIRTLTEAKGFDTAKHVLACFGGAGGQHACAVARALGMKKVKIHKNAGVLSAYGLILADVVVEKQTPHLKAIGSSYNEIESTFKKLIEDSKESLTEQGFSENDMKFERILHMRYDRTDAIIFCSDLDGTFTEKDFVEDFEKHYRREFGFVIQDREIIVDDVRVRGVGSRFLAENKKKFSKTEGKLKSITSYKGYFENGTSEMHFYKLDDMLFGDIVEGPAVIIDKNCTILVEPNCKAVMTEYGDIMIEVDELKEKTNEKEEGISSIHLSIFSHRFMSIAEQMGKVLCRSAISTNIKERLDFSCALFGPNGHLVANAPHIPVHLGGMQSAVQSQLEYYGKEGLKPGDVLLSNHPSAGGSHLPDLTIITPVFMEGTTEPDFFVANRGHHADIGGLVPGSMPPHSTLLIQEGAIFKHFKVVDDGKFREEELTRILKEPGKVPNCSGTRNLRDNLADLRAQIAANQKGILLLTELVKAYGIDTVKKYMNHIQSAAETAVREMLKEKASKTERSETFEGKTYRFLTFTDYMDDGSPISLNVYIEPETGDAIFDFSNSGPQVYSSINAPKAITTAAVIYCLRCLVNEDIPLNQGCLAPITIKLVKGSILDPREDAAVVGGNVQTSQRLCDVVFGAFGEVAASQGCMNNITFGDDSLGYYETVAGGAGAGRNFHGRSAVHTHMTNTRITDVEILEARYPVILRRFAIRTNSGGKGKWNGGDGVLREYVFRRPMKLSVMTERRALQPYGLEGGEPAKRGLNILLREGVYPISLGPKNSIDVHPKDIFELWTPGGGGFGAD
uniref:5-oxoprolinase n=1 Tax=Panagrolaimus sp. JU765 TaxID=591449 RepID=A0AC34RIK5_9BILA